jgi:hypothetical protein
VILLAPRLSSEQARICAEFDDEVERFAMACTCLPPPAKPHWNYPQGACPVMRLDIDRANRRITEGWFIPRIAEFYAAEILSRAYSRSKVHDSLRARYNFRQQQRSR